jgi:hypothetical protein
MICQCVGCFRRIPENTRLCIPCQPSDLIPPWHGPGGNHGYQGGLDDAQLLAIHNLLESLYNERRDVAWMTSTLYAAVQDFYREFRGEPLV